MAKRSVSPVSRRAFLGTAGGALLASPLVSVWPAHGAQVPDFPLPERPGKKLGWAVVGLGRLAVNQILPAFSECKRSRLTGLVSGRPEKARHLAQLQGVETRNLYSYELRRDRGHPAIDVQAARYLAGEEPVEVEAMMHSTPGDPRFTEVEENVTFQLRFPGGILANCASSYGARLNRFRVFKPGGSAELEPALSYGGLRMRVFRDNAVEERPQPVVDHFEAEMDHFSGCVMLGTEPLTPGDEGLRDLRLIRAIYDAARAGRPVQVAA
jgi:predicted dehydrogenase